LVRKTEKLLNNFNERVEALCKTGADMGGFDQMEASGIAGTHMEDTLSIDVASWLTRRMPGKVVIASDHYDPGRELGTSGSRLRHRDYCSPRLFGTCPKFQLD
jgi:hypothetical protein